MKHTTNSSNFRPHHAGIRTTMFGGLALFSFSLLPMAAHADDSEVPDQTPAVAATEFSNEGKQLLAATLLLAAALVGMERFCSWRLSLHHRRANDVRQIFTECVPPLKSEPSSLFSPTP